MHRYIYIYIQLYIYIFVYIYKYLYLHVYIYICMTPFKWFRVCGFGRRALRVMQEFGVLGLGHVWSRKFSKDPRSGLEVLGI